MQEATQLEWQGKQEVTRVVRCFGGEGGKRGCAATVGRTNLREEGNRELLDDEA